MHLKSVLPEEILLEIFSEIEQSDLRKFLEISSEWRDLLIKNAKVMRKLPLILMNDTWKAKLGFVENYGKFIRRVEFNGTSLGSFDDVLTVLRCTPNVEKLSLTNVKLAEMENEEEEEKSENSVGKLALKRLKEVEVEDVENVGVLGFVEANLEIKLTRLRCNLSHVTHLPIIERLLAQNQHLKVLEIHSELEEVFNPNDDALSVFKFQLDNLLVKSNLMRHNEQFVKFLKSQSKLQEIAFHADHVDFRYTRMMFTSFPSIRSLHLNIDTLSTSDCLMKLRRIPANKSLRTLNVLGRNLHLNVFDAILRLSPKITDLSIQNLTQFHSDKIRALPLTHLRVGRVNCDFLSAGLSTKIHLNEIQNPPMETYERNLQNFCDLSRLGDQRKDSIEAF